jgi:hypothetical protein
MDLIGDIGEDNESYSEILKPLTDWILKYIIITVETNKI